MIGAQLIHYQITAKLGQGGMGEVYRARDTKLGREVAIKVLPTSFTSLPESAARFEREAKALATLNHPGIASIYGFDIANGKHFLVMELVEGETLEARLQRGALPAEDAMDIARQIAAALEAAHERGIIHRDLKPANVKITPEGRVKLLDFGLAKATEISTQSALADSPTLLGTVQGTSPGMILGTPAYMSPEQARGGEVDKRTDVWAFGCCLYECLSGRQAFHGATTSDVLAEVLKANPDWSAIPNAPPALLTVLRRCLEKDPRRRLSSLGDISITLAATIPENSSLYSSHPLVSSSTNKIGQYQILRVIGEGGMGTVFEAEQDNPRRIVALKVIRGGFASGSLLRRFELEAQVLGRLQHPGIAQIYEAGTANSGEGPQPFFAMEFVRGGSLWEFIRKKGLGTRQRLELIVKICDAVHYAHQQGIIHRDLKPANILLDSAGQPKILDFGVARATDADIQLTTMQTDVGQLIGTLVYMSPEQVAADPDQLDIRSDVYALGIITFELLAETLPYSVSGKNIPEAARIIREDDPAPLSSVNRLFRGDIETIVAKALEKDKTRRYQSAAELGDDIRRYLTNEPIVARPPSAIYQLQKFAQRNRALVFGVLGVFVTLVVGIIVSAAMYFTAERERGSAVTARDTATRERDRALAAEKRAEESFRMARSAVDRYLNQITESAELKANGFEELRRKLLSNARVFYEQFVRQRANDPALQRDLAEAHLSLGNISRTVGQTDEALAAYNRAHEIAGKLAQGTKPAAKDLASIANLDGNLGLVYSEIGRFKEAEQFLLRAKQFENQIAELDPGDTNQPVRLSNIANNLGILYENRRQASLAESNYLHAIKLRESLSSKNPADSEAVNTLIASYNNLAKLFATTGRAIQAEPYLIKAVELAEILAANHPQNPEIQNSLAASYGNLAGVFILAGKLDEARLSYEKSLPIRERLIARHPSVLNYRLLISSTYCNLGEINVLLKQPAPALPWFDKALHTLQQILAQEPRHTTARYYASYTRSWRAQAFELQKENEKALQDLEKAIELDDNKDLNLLQNRDRILKLLGKG